MRIQAMVVRIIRQFIRDKRTLGMLVAAPILILTLMSVVFSSDALDPKIGIVTEHDALLEAFNNKEIEVYEFSSVEDALQATEDKEVHGFIEVEGQSIRMTIEGSDPNVNKSVIMTVQEVLSQLQSPNVSNKPEIIYIHGSEEMDTFDNVGPFLIGFFVFFFIFLIAGVSFLRERTTGTLERLLSTPLRRWEIVIGYVIGFGIFTTIQAGIIVWFSIEILDIMMFGSIFFVMLVAFMLAITALTLGTLLSAYARNELQMIQFIPLVVVPQVFFSGLFNIDTMNPWLQSISVIMPLTYGGEAMRDIMIRGGGWSSIWSEVVVLLGFALLFMVLNTLALKKHRKL
ncbi:ABC transporter permease [Bacillus salitolerans]|uniref:ABC transporter permease n=1 Tax=Bacillus salitolerans TaxID=1437434 RepID=A0ABW4LM24_9BACI